MRHKCCHIPDPTSRGAVLSPGPHPLAALANWTKLRHAHTQGIPRKLPVPVRMVSWLDLQPRAVLRKCRSLQSAIEGIDKRGTLSLEGRGQTVRVREITDDNA